MQDKLSAEISSADAESIVETATSFLAEIESCGLKYNVRLDAVYSSILAHPLERFILNVLRKKYADVKHDGGPGKHDIYFMNSGYALEVKTTQSLRKLQIDVDTWPQNIKKNIIYFVRKPNSIDQWVVILFEGLEKEMFGKTGSASKNSKGKASMKKWKAWSNAKILIGDVKQTTKVYKNGGKRLCFSPIYKRVRIVR